MNERVVEVEGTPRYLSLLRGFMIISGPEGELGRVVLEDIAVVVIASPGVTLTSALLIALADRGAGAILCGEGYKPAAWLLPMVGHHRQGERMLHQVDASLPLRKGLWREVVKAKILAQAEILKTLGREWRGVRELAGQVHSGDGDNVEAQAARRYWPLLMGEAFRRETEGADEVNAMLNYGYAVLRSAMARSVAGAGLHPSLGIHHRGPTNPLNLADDLLEPFRPLVDYTVMQLLANGGNGGLNKENKSRLAAILTTEVKGVHGVGSVRIAMERLAHSLAVSFEEGGIHLEFPKSLILENDS